MKYIKAFVFVAFGIGLLASVPVAKAASLIGLYTFDGGNANDSSGNGNDPTAVGSAVGFVADGSNPAGGLAGSFTISSDSFITVPIDINPSALPAVTMGAWVKAASNGGGGAGKVLSHDNLGFDRTLGIDPRSGTGFAATTEFAAFRGPSTGVVQDSSGALSFGSWAFLAVVYNGSSSFLYVNGATTAFNASNGGGLTSLTIGRNPCCGENFDGLIDNVFVFDGALTTSELSEIQASGFSTVPVPAALPLLLTGLTGLGLIGWRRRKAA